MREERQQSAPAENGEEKKHAGAKDGRHETEQDRHGGAFHY
jgi:hypothetical protein